MNKTPLAFLLLCAFAGAASAQSTVRVYGSLDGGLRNVTNVNAAGDSQLTMNSPGIYRPSRIGFIGTEDLGSGRDVHFLLESRYRLGSGAQIDVLFAGAAYVGMRTEWGTVDIGRVPTVSFYVVGRYDPFAFKYTGIEPAIRATMGVAENNSIQYSGQFGPVTAMASYGFGEQAGSIKDGASRSFGFNYADGPLNAGAAYANKDSLTGLDIKQFTAGGGYAFGAWRATVGYVDIETKVLVGHATVTKYLWSGLQYKLTPQLELIGAYFQTKVSQASGVAEGKKDLFLLSATYALSKRTNLYSEIDRAKMRGNQATAGQSYQTGVSAGINHMF